LDVSRAASAYVPELAANDLGAVTVEQVMLHTAGFPNAPMPALDGGDPERRRARFAQWRSEWEPRPRLEDHAGSAHWVLVGLRPPRLGRAARDGRAAPAPPARHPRGPAGQHRAVRARRRGPRRNDADARRTGGTGGRRPREWRDHARG